MMMLVSKIIRRPSRVLRMITNRISIREKFLKYHYDKEGYHDVDLLKEKIGSFYNHFIILKNIPSVIGNILVPRIESYNLISGDYEKLRHVFGKNFPNDGVKLYTFIYENMVNDNRVYSKELIIERNILMRDFLSKAISIIPNKGWIDFINPITGKGFYSGGDTVLIESDSMYSNYGLDVVKIACCTVLRKNGKHNILVCSVFCRE